MRISDWSSDVCSSDLVDEQSSQRLGRSAGYTVLRKNSAAPATADADRRAGHGLYASGRVGVPRQRCVDHCGRTGARSRLMGAGPDGAYLWGKPFGRSEEHTSELQSLMRISYAVFCLKKKIKE